MTAHAPASTGHQPAPAQAGLTVSQSERNAFRHDGRTATEARARSPSRFGFQLERLIRSAGAGFEPATG